jgi:hypothetical protein
MLDRNYFLVHENQTNNLILYNASFREVKILEGVHSASLIDLNIYSKYFDLNSSSLVKNLNLRYFSS